MELTVPVDPAHIERLLTSLQKGRALAGWAMPLLVDAATPLESPRLYLGMDPAQEGGDASVFKSLSRALPAKPLPRPKFAKPAAEDWDHDVRKMHPDEHAIHLRHHEKEYLGLQAQFHGLDPQAEDFPEQQGAVVQKMRKCARHYQAHLFAKHAPKVPAEARKKATPAGMAKSVERWQTLSRVLDGYSQTEAIQLICGGLGIPAEFLGPPASLAKAAPALTVGVPAGSVEEHQRNLARAPVLLIDPHTGAARARQIEFRGLPITIETNAGEVRRGPGWENTMRVAYGEIEGTMGQDGDPVDVFVGPVADAPKVWVVHIHTTDVFAWPGGCCPTCGHTPDNCWHALDEDKVFLGFQNRDDVLACFKVHYDNEAFLGPVSELTFDRFVECLLRGERPWDTDHDLALGVFA